MCVFVMIMLLVVVVVMMLVADDASGTPILYQVISDDDYDGDCRVVIAGGLH